MSVPTESITQERLRSWSRRLSEQHSTPLILIGIGHDSKKGQLMVVTVEDVNDDFLAASLTFALQSLKPTKVEVPEGLVVAVKRDKPTTPEQCAIIALSEYNYWRTQERTDDSISGMAAASNIYAAITGGMMAPWHPQ